MSSAEHLTPAKPLSIRAVGRALRPRVVSCPGDPVLQRIPRQFCCGVQSQLVHQRHLVEDRRFDRECQHLGDLLGRASFGN